jgi:hypothetical protein
MQNLLAQVHYGFYGLHGFLGVILGLVLCLIIIWGIWSIFDIIAAKFSKPETGWMFQIVRIVLIVATVVWFVNAIFGIFPS